MKPDDLARQLVGIFADRPDPWPIGAVVADLALDLAADRSRSLVDRCRRWRWTYKTGRVRFDALIAQARELAPSLGNETARISTESRDKGKGANEGQTKGKKPAEIRAVSAERGKRRANEGQKVGVSITPPLVEKGKREKDKTRARDADELVSAIYAAYPRHKAPFHAFRAIRSAARKGYDLADLLIWTERFAEFVRLEKTPAKFIPYPATFFNGGDFLNYRSAPGAPADPETDKGLSNGTGTDDRFANVTADVARNRRLLSDF